MTDRLAERGREARDHSEMAVEGQDQAEAEDGEEEEEEVTATAQVNSPLLGIYIESET